MDLFSQYLATILFGLVRFVSQILGCFLLLRFPRRALLVVSALLVSLVTDTVYIKKTKLEKPFTMSRACLSLAPPPSSAPGRRRRGKAA